MILRDLNIDLLSEIFHKPKFIDMITNFDMEKSIPEPSRYTTTTKTLLEFVIKHFKNVVLLVHSEPKIIDHHLLSTKVYNKKN